MHRAAILAIAKKLFPVGLKTEIMREATLQDYLKTIYKLETAARDRVSTSALAERMLLSHASVTNMLKKLSEESFISYEPYKGATLTPKGSAIALQTIRRHRIIELFLVEKLGLGWDEVDTEAETLEHAISDTLLDRMAISLGDPAVDPHGSPIPTKEGFIAEDCGSPLTSARVGDTLAVVRVREGNPEKLRYLANLGLIPRAQFHLLAKAPFDGPLSISIGNAEHHLGSALCDGILVQACEHEVRPTLVGKEDSL